MFRTLALGPLDLGLAQAWLDRSDSACSYFILQGKNVVNCTIVTLGPNVGALLRLNQLCCDPYAARSFSHAAFEHVAHAQFTPYLLDIDRPAFVGEARVARDNEEPFESGQAGGDILDQSICEIFLLRIAAHILER